MKTIVASLLLLVPMFANALPTTNRVLRAAVVEWDNSPTGTNVNSYTVYCSTNHFWIGTNMVLTPSLAGQWQVPGTTNQFTTTEVLKPGLTYYFVVTATSSGFESDYSQEASVLVTPRVLPPSLHITIQLVGSSTPVGPWDPVDLLAEYWITPDCDYAFYRDVLTIHR